MRARATRQANRNGFLTAAEETLSYSLSEQFGRIFGKYVDPHSFTFISARGYWAHGYQDVQRISGHFRVGETTYTFGSWEFTPSTLARYGCHVIDDRSNPMALNDFILEKGREPEERPDNDYNSIQLEEIAWKKSQGLL